MKIALQIIGFVLLAIVFVIGSAALAAVIRDLFGVSSGAHGGR